MERISRAYSTPTIALTTVLLAALVSGCGTTFASTPLRSEPSSSTAPLTGKRWMLDGFTVRGDSRDVPDRLSPWMEFDGDEGTITGYDGCNHFGGSAEFGTDTVTITDFGTTEIGCWFGDDAGYFPPNSGSLRAKTTADTLTLTTTADGVTFLLHAETTTKPNR